MCKYRTLFQCLYLYSRFIVLGASRYHHDGTRCERHESSIQLRCTAYVCGSDKERASLQSTALSLFAWANLQVRTEPVAAASSKGEHLVLVFGPRLVHVPCLVATRIGKLGYGRKGPMRSHRVRFRSACIFSHVLR
jgi:hypothetical protein